MPRRLAIYVRNPKDAPLLRSRHVCADVGGSDPVPRWAHPPVRRSAPTVAADQTPSDSTECRRLVSICPRSQKKKSQFHFFFTFTEFFSATLSLNAGRRDWRGCGRGFLFEEVMFQAVSVTFQINPTGLYLISHIVVSKFTTKRNLIFKNLTNIFSNRTFIYYRKKRVRKMWN